MHSTSFQNLQGEKIAVLVANGFNERDLTAIQKLLQEHGAHIRIVAMDSSLVNSWNGAGWGLNFAADSMLNEALAVDYSMLLVPGGRRSVDKLKLTAHTRRFINGFLDSGKPLAMVGEALELLGHFERLPNRSVAVPAEYKEEADRLGANVVSEGHALDKNLLTGDGATEGFDAFVQAVIEHFAAVPDLEQAA